MNDRRIPNMLVVLRHTRFNRLMYWWEVTEWLQGNTVNVFGFCLSQWRAWIYSNFTGWKYILIIDLTLKIVIFDISRYLRQREKHEARSNS